MVSGYTHGLIASGWLDAAIDSPDCEAFDVAAVMAVLEGAGCTVLQVDTTSGLVCELKELDRKCPSRNYRAVVARNAELAHTIAHKLLRERDTEGTALQARL